MNQHGTDLTRGGILNKILMVALPIMGTQLLQMTYNLTDMFWLGRMEDSVTAVAASGLGGMFIWLGMALLLIGRIGSEIGVSQNLGAGDRATAQEYAENSARIALILGSLYGLVLLTLAGPLVSLLRVAEKPVFDAASDYLRIISFGGPLAYLSAAIGGGFSSAVSAFVGQNYGARQWARIRRGYRISLASLLMWEFLVMLVLAFGGRFLFSLFLSQPPELVRMGGDYLFILAGCQLFMALEGTCGGTFRGMGRTLPPSISSITSNLIRPFLCWALAQTMGLNGFWLGITLSASLRGLMMFIWYTLYQRKLPREDEARFSGAVLFEVE